MSIRPQAQGAITVSESEMGGKEGRACPQLGVTPTALVTALHVIYAAKIGYFRVDTPRCEWVWVGKEVK